MAVTQQKPRFRITSDRGAGHPPPKVREEKLPYVLTPVTPSDPRNSDSARLLFCYLEAVAGSDSSGELALLEVLMAAEDEDFAGAGWSDRHRTLAGLMSQGLLGHADQNVAAAVHSQLARQAAHAAGLLGDVEHWLHRAGVALSPEGHELLHLPYRRALDELLGWEDVDGWHPGRSLLEPQEQNAFRLSLELQGEQDDRGLWSYRLLQPWEIRDRMSRRRGDLRDPLPVERVVECLSRARRKVRECLLPPED